jgi:hypothetical protein
MTSTQTIGVIRRRNHSYFISNPRVSPDIIAMLRYGLRPSEPGRPLEQLVGPFWRVPTQ